jgi:hypothetical protein
MNKLLYFFLLIGLTWSCKDPKSTVDTAPVAQDSLVVTPPVAVEKLIQFSPEFSTRFALEDWKQLMEMKRDFENLKRLNPKGLSLFLRGLERQCTSVLNSDFPPPFNQNAIKSRLRVVLTEVMKAQYLATNKQNDSLKVSLQNMYVAYTAFMERIISAGEAASLNSTEE